MVNNYLIIGGAGFIGSHLVDVCYAAGKNVIVYDNFSLGKMDYLKNSPNIEIVKGDILDLNALRACIEKYQPEVVFHLAAIHFIPACENDPANALRVNVEGTQNVLSATANTTPKLIFTSTGAIYDPEITAALNEQSTIRTGDIYGITKLTAEELVKYHVKKERGQAVIARLFNAVGPRETNPHLIPAIMEQISAGNRHVELGNLYPKRDYIHVRDIAEGLFAIAETSLIGALEVFNIGSGLEYSVEELVKLCGEVSGKPINIESVKSRRRKHDRSNQLANIEKIKNICSWTPNRSLIQALIEIWNHEMMPLLASEQKDKFT
jgi:UDP-glucose 4-epimerase